MYEVIAGIDLGTTNSAVCVVEDGVPRILPVHGQPTMPSAVGLDPTGKLIVGQAAKNQQISAPERTITSIKRLMGEDTKVTLGDRQLSPEEVSALILKELKQAAEKELGVPVKKAVITVPAFFNERQRKATQVAGDLAGLEVVRIINEPLLQHLPMVLAVRMGRPCWCMTWVVAPSMCLWYGWSLEWWK